MYDQIITSPNLLSSIKINHKAVMKNKSLYTHSGNLGNIKDYSIKQ